MPSNSQASLIKNKNGKVVSKKSSAAGKKALGLAPSAGHRLAERVRSLWLLHKWDSPNAHSES